MTAVFVELVSILEGSELPLTDKLDRGCGSVVS
jgi:hypothetical protein